MIPLSVGKGLDKNIKNNILNRAYTEEQLRQILNMINNSKNEAKTALIADAVVLFLAFGFIVYQMTEGFKDMIKEGIIFFIVLYSICMLILYWSLFKARKNQFLKAVKKAYPELNLN